jgi:hypothetical protein
VKFIKFKRQVEFLRKPKKYIVPSTGEEWELMRKIDDEQTNLANLLADVWVSEDRIRGLNVELHARQAQRMRDNSSLKLWR